MAFIATAAIIGGSIAVAGGAAKLGMSLAGRKKRIAEQNAAREQMQDRMTEYENLDTSNLKANVQNQFTNMENTYEDMTVNQQQAQFEAQQGQQQRANIMSNMAGAAGSSGVAGLAQAMANQGQVATQRASASIGQQESANQKAAAQQAGQIQNLERQGAWKADMTRLSGAEQSRELVKDKTNTLFTMSANQLAQRESAHQQAQSEMWSGIGSALSPLG